MTKIGKNTDGNGIRENNISSDLLIGIITRIFRFGITPGGINQDGSICCERSMVFITLWGRFFGYTGRCI